MFPKLWISSACTISCQLCTISRLPRKNKNISATVWQFAITPPPLKTCLALRIVI